MELDNWMNKVIQSYKPVKEIPLSNELRGRLYAIPNQSKQYHSLKSKSVFYLAASVILVLGFNLFSWIRMNQVSDNKGTEVMQYFNYINRDL